MSVAQRAVHVSRVLRELPTDEVFDTVYFGGGTPALCDLDQIFTYLRLSENYEFTVELHPLDVTESLLHVLKRGRVNRISLGVQSFDDEALAAMGRKHDASMAEDAFRLVQKFFPNSGLDLIAGWPGTSEEAWRNTLSRSIALNPTHMSCYTLIHEQKTLLDLAVRKGKVVLPGDDEALAQLDVAAEMFAASGLVRYEVSNYARPGFECRHNCAVWRGEDYLGLGEGSHGRIGLTRTRGLACGYETTSVTEYDDAFERAVLGIRTTFGIDIAATELRFPILAEYIPTWRKMLKSLIPHGIMTSPAHDVFVPTHRGLEVCDAILSELHA